MSEPTADRDPFEVIAGSFLARYRAGERPSVEEYAALHPDLADLIRELLPALVMVERDLTIDRDPVPAGVRRSPALSPGNERRLGDYRILREIGRGGMGVVYEAEQMSLGRRVALKVLPGQVARDGESLKRFRREAKAAARLHHTNIVPVYEVGHDGETAYYAMQFIQGQGLDQVIDELVRLRDRGRKPDVATGPRLAEAATSPGVPAPAIGRVAESLLSGQIAIEGAAPSCDIPQSDAANRATGEKIARDPNPGRDFATAETAPIGADTTTPPAPSALLPGGSQVSTAYLSSRRSPYFGSVARIGRQVAQGLAYAHASGIVHRDIKPSNLLLDHAGVVWIADFGLAKGDDEGLTQTGDIVGTLRYMAPCRFRGEVDPRSDIYALGLTLYELLTLRPAFDSSDRLKLIEQIKNAEPPGPRAIDPRIPRDLETIVLKAIEKDPKARYQSAEAMAEDLRRFLADEPIRARQVSTRERYWRWARRNPVIAVLGGVLTALMVAVTAASLTAASYFRNAAQRESNLARRERLASNEMNRIAARAEAEKEIAQREGYRSTMKLAESMLQGDDQARYRVADILWGAQPELRGWEWGHLMARCPLERWSLQTNQGGLDSVAASADGRLLATAGRDGTVALWDSWTLRELWRQTTGRARKLEIDPLTRHVGVCSADSSRPPFRILLVETGRIVHEAAGTGGADIAFGPGGRDLYVLRIGAPPIGRTAPSEGTLERIVTEGWERRASVVLAPLHHPSDLKVFVDLAGVYVGVHDEFIGFDEHSAADHAVRLFDAQTLRPSADLDPILPRYSSTIRPATPVLHSGYGEVVYSDGLRLQRNSRSGPSLHISHPGIINYLAFDPRSQLGLAGSPDGTVTIRDADGESQTLSHGSSICGLARLPDGRLVTGGVDGLLKCWTPGLVATLAIDTNAEPSSAQAELVAFADSGASLLFPQRANFHLFRTSDLTYRSFPLKAVGDYAGQALLTEPKTNELVVATDAGLSFYDLLHQGTRLVETRSIDFPRPYHAAFDASGRILVASNHDREVAVFDVTSKRRLPAPEARGLGVVSVNPGGTRAALLTGTSLQVWDVSTGRLLNRLDGPLGAVQTGKWERDQRVPVFHRDGDLLAFVAEAEDTPPRLILWDTALGKLRSSVQARPGVGFGHLAFSTGGDRLFVCGSRLFVWDWRIGKELVSLSSPHYAAVSPDGVTIATAGWNPSLTILKALPWSNLARGDGDLYRAVDDLWMYTAGLPRSIKMTMVAAGNLDSALADEAEILGDIQRRHGQTAASIPHYTKAIEIRQSVVLADPGQARQHYRLATAYEKRLAVAAADDPAAGATVLQQAVDYWQKLASKVPHQTSAWRQCLDFQLRLVDAQIARTRMVAHELLLPHIRFWCEWSRRGPPDSLVQYALHEFWARMAVAAPGFLADRNAIDDLVDRHSQLRSVIGERYAADRNWGRAIAIFSKPVTEGSGYDHVRKLLALACAGPGKDVPPIDDAARAKLRRQALDWLQAELEASNRRLGSAPPRDLPDMAQAFRFWKEDPYLAGIREAETLARLPSGEQKSWEKLWADVDSLLNRLPAPKTDEPKLDPDDPEMLEGIHLRAHQLAPSKPSEAEPLFRRALKAYRRLQGPDGSLTLDLTRDLTALLNQSGRGAEAEPLLRDALEQLRKQSGPDEFRMAGILAPLGQSLIQQGKWTEAEPLLRECLVVRENLQPDEWTTFATRSHLGQALLGQNKYAESEPLIISGYEGMKAREARIPPQNKQGLGEAAERIVKLYDAWGKPDKAADWRARLARPNEAPRPQP
ncbi:WD40 repeat domain-containing serine/threonine protein kinase [Aquisphaera insulae]|uniref:WD40 repeat domain-containing serine/threonine protein kinase n=1 Tax=Aquisphaera insulae TaxID=2712864 RepID=UPI0013EB45A5|nr:protein kinase [Aquisphaera insulae]